MNGWGEYSVFCGDGQEESPNMPPISYPSLSRLEAAKAEVQRKEQGQICTLSHTDDTQGLALPSWLAGTPSSHGTRLTGMTTVRALLVPEDHRWIYHCCLPRDHKSCHGQVLHHIYSQLYPLPLNCFSFKATFIFLLYKSGSFWSVIAVRVKPGHREAGLGIWGLGHSSPLQVQVNVNPPPSSLSKYTISTHCWKKVSVSFTLYELKPRMKLVRSI